MGDNKFVVTNTCAQGSFLELIVPLWRQRASIFRFVRGSHIFKLASSHRIAALAMRNHIDHAFPRVRLVLHAAGESNSPTLQQLFVVVTPKKMFKAQPPTPSRMQEGVSFPSLLSYRKQHLKSFQAVCATRAVKRRA